MFDETFELSVSVPVGFADVLVDVGILDGDILPVDISVLSDLWVSYIAQLDE